MNLLERKNKKGDKITFYYDLGRGPEQRPSTGIFIYAKPKNQTEKNHNKESLKLLDVKKSNFILENQAIGTGFIPTHKFKDNFLDYYEEYIKLNKRDGNRHLSCSFSRFKKFLGKDFIHPSEVTENLCKRFQRYLLDNLTGETPANYFARFKWVIDAATSDGYFRTDICDKIPAKPNPSVKLKENLEVDEYLELLNVPCSNDEVKFAFLFCCYTGLRWIDVKGLKWKDINGDLLTTRIIQAKTGRPVILTLHPIAQRILKNREHVLGSSLCLDNPVFVLPSANGANKVLKGWIAKTSINRHITWSCARLSLSILLKDKNVDDVTIAYIMGQTTTKQVQRTYKRHRPKNQLDAISNLPAPDQMPYFLDINVMGFGHGA